MIQSTVDIREKIVEFERQRQTLLSVNMQKQQLEVSVNGLTKALEELSNSKEEKAYKAAGNILVAKDRKELVKELEELKETQSLRVKTLDKQEKSLVEKLNKLKTEIESQAGKAAAAPILGEGATVISSKKDSA